MERKNYFLTKASSRPYYCKEHLLGIVKRPKLPKNHATTNRNKIKAIKEDIEKFDKEANNAWSFIFQMLDGSHLECYIDTYINKPKGHQLAREAIMKHYDDQSQAQIQQSYDAQIDNLTVLESSDPKTDFYQVVNELEKICNILASQPHPHQVILNDTSKKLKLQRALAKCKRFDHIITQGSTVTDDYETYITSITQLIINIQINAALSGKTTANDNKLAQAKNETVTSKALLTIGTDTVNYDDLLKDAKPDEINALKTTLKSNWNRFNRATTKFYKNNKRDTDNRDDSSDNTNKRPRYDNRQQGRGGGRSNGRSNYQGRGNNNNNNNNNHQYNNNHNNNNRNNNYNNSYQHRNDYRGERGGRGGRGGRGRKKQRRIR